MLDVPKLRGSLLYKSRSREMLQKDGGEQMSHSGMTVKTCPRCNGEGENPALLFSECPDSVILDGFYCELCKGHGRIVVVQGAQYPVYRVEEVEGE